LPEKDLILFFYDWISNCNILSICPPAHLIEEQRFPSLPLTNLKSSVLERTQNHACKMASSRTVPAFTRNLLSASRGTFRTATTRTAAQFARQNFRQQSQRRGYANSTSPKSEGSNTIYWLLGLGAVGGGGYYFYSQNSALSRGKSEPKIFSPTFDDYQKVYDAIAERLEEHDEYEDGSYGPVVLRLAWHASGTYVRILLHTILLIDFY